MGCQVVVLEQGGNLGLLSMSDDLPRRADDGADGGIGGPDSAATASPADGLPPQTITPGGLERDNVYVLLGPLADNGRVTLTHLPEAGSPAIDHDADCSFQDQRGVARPQGPACDMGAVEVEMPVQ